MANFKKNKPIVQELLGRALDPRAAQHVLNDKIAHRTFFLRPTTSDAREARRSAREANKKQRKKPLRPKPLSARQRRGMGLYDVPREGQKFAIFEPLHRLWLGYVREVLEGEIYTGGQGAAAKLASADMQGAEVEVVRSRCPGRVGIRGIVVKDSKSVFEIITPQNQLKVVPKEGTVFRVPIPVARTGLTGENGGKAGNKETGAEKPDSTAASLRLSEGKESLAAHERPRMIFEIHGDQFIHRAADRANKKIKGHFLENL